MSATRKLRKLFTRFRSDGVSSRTSGLSGVGPPPELRIDPRIRQLDVAGVVWGLAHLYACCKGGDGEVSSGLGAAIGAMGGAGGPGFR